MSKSRPPAGEVDSQHKGMHEATRAIDGKEAADRACVTSDDRRACGEALRRLLVAVRLGSILQ